MNTLYLKNKCSHLISLLFIFSCSDLFARAGGSSGGVHLGSLGTSRYRATPNNESGAILLIFLPFIFGWFFIMASYVDHRIKKRRQYIHEMLDKMSSLEEEWKEENLINISKAMFEKIQSQWGGHKVSELRSSLSVDLFAEWKDKIEIQESTKEVNSLINITFQDVFIVDVKNYLNDKLDSFTTCFDISAVDQTTLNGHQNNYHLSSFREFWTFQRNKDNWKLVDIDQARGWRRFANAHIVFETKQSTKPA